MTVVPPFRRVPFPFSHEDRLRQESGTTQFAGRPESALLNRAIVMVTVSHRTPQQRRATFDSAVTIKPTGSSKINLVEHFFAANLAAIWQGQVAEHFFQPAEELDKLDRCLARRLALPDVPNARCLLSRGDFAAHR